MSVNFNVAMLRNLQKPIDESLETSITQLSQYVAGTLSPEDFDAGQHIRLVVGSLSVIGCQAAAKIAETLEDAATGLAKPDRRGWEKDKALRVAEASLVLTTGLLNHLRELLLDNEDLPVKMWPAWQTLLLAMEAPSRSAEELFEPDADFDDLRFALLADDYLKDVTNGMIERLESAIEKLSNTQSSNDMALVLQDSLKIFDWAYSLRHGKGYQPYWLALRARLSIGLLGDQEKLEDRAEWNVLLKEALLEIHKFARGSRRVSPELLMKTLRPMLIRWPSHWVSSHPILAEADRRLGFRDFWDTLDDVTQNQTKAVSLSGMQFDDHIELLSQIKQGWAQYVSGEGADVRISFDKSIALLNSRRSIFADPALVPLFDEIMLVSGELDMPGSVPESISLEFASALLLLDDAVERRFKVSPSSGSQIGLQTKRLKAARLNLVGDLQQLPKVRWDSKKQERQLRAAKIAVFAEIHKDVLLIEEALTEQLRDESYKPDVNKIKSMSVLASAVFRLLECEAAANIVTGVSSLIGEKSDEALSSITLGVAGLGAYLTALENGDQDAEHLLAAAHNAVVGRPLPGGSLSEEQWRQTQAPIEEHVVTLPLALSNESEENSVLPGKDQDDIVEDNDETIESLDSVSRADAESVSIEPSAFNPESVFELTGYRETRTNNELEVFFLDEMEQVLEEISLQRSRLKEDPFNNEARSDLRRQFHTIKGSGRLAGFMGIGEIGYLLEHRMDQDIEENISYSSQIDVLVENVSNEMSQWLRELSAGNDIIVNGALVQAWVEASEISEHEEVTVVDTAEEKAEIVSGQATPWSPYEQSVPVPVSEKEEDLSVEVAEATEETDSDVHFSPEVVEINGFGLLDKETFSKIVFDFSLHHDVFENAASTASDEEVEIGPIIAATHDITVVAASLGMAPIATLGRAFEKYLEELSKTSLWPKWTSTGQSAAEEMWLMVDDLVMRKSISSINMEVLEALKEKVVEENALISEEPLDAFNGDLIDDRSLHSEEALELDDIISSDSQHHSDHTGVISPPDEEVVEAAFEDRLQVVEHLLPVVDQLAQDGVHALSEGGDSELSDEDDDVLWEKLFDSLSTISKELRVVVPILTKIHERRR